MVRKKQKPIYCDYIVERLGEGPLLRSVLMPEDETRPTMLLSMDQLVEDGLVGKAFGPEGNTIYYLMEQENELLTAGRIRQEDIVRLNNYEGHDIPGPHKPKRNKES